MIVTIYTVILSYFVLGAIGFYFINRKKDKQTARQSWTKFITYFCIIHILFFSMVVHPLAFQVVAILIAGVGGFELFRLFRNNNYKLRRFFAITMGGYVCLSFGFIMFSHLQKETILFAFLVLSIFDAFSQISGQLFGKNKIAPTISPNKTVEGTVGGGLIAMLSSLLLHGLYDDLWYRVVILAGGVVLFAFFGDIAASLYKRKFKVKDYSQLIPGHGGFLDRFDSLIAGGTWVSIFFYMVVENF